MNRLVLMTFRLQAGEDLKQRQERIKTVLDSAIDWVRYMPNCWIVRTNRSVADWQKLLRPVLGPKDTFFIVKLDARERSGWLAPWVWDWIRKHDSENDGVPPMGSLSATEEQAPQLQHATKTTLRDWTVPLPSGDAVLRLPRPMKEKDFKKLKDWLDWVKDTLVPEENE